MITTDGEIYKYVSLPSGLPYKNVPLSIENEHSINSSQWSFETYNVFLIDLIYSQ